jgi:uncharacterized protein DUF3618
MNTTSQRPEDGLASEQLERTADRLRADLDRTLDALERRLAPSQLLDRSLTYLRDHGGEMAHAVGDSVRRNPVPILLTVAGLGWLIVSAVRRREPIDLTVGNEYSADDDDPSSLAESLDDGLVDDESPYTEPRSARSRFYGGIEAARAQTRRVRYRVVSAVEERPLLFGGLAVAIGALLGAVIPSTQYEDKVVGQIRDRAVERAKQMGERQYQNLRSRFDTQDLEVSGQAH